MKMKKFNNFMVYFLKNYKLYDCGNLVFEKHFK